MEYKYRLGLKQQLLLLNPLILKNGILIGIYFYFFGDDIPIKISIYIFVVFIFIDILPTLIVHIQYLYYNWKAQLIINVSMKFFIYQTPLKKMKYMFSDILSIRLYGSYGGGTGIYSFAEYRYFKIILKDQTEIIITCLMMNDIKNTLGRLLETNAEKYFKIIAFVY